MLRARSGGINQSTNQSTNPYLALQHIKSLVVARGFCLKSGRRHVGYRFSGCGVRFDGGTTVRQFDGGDQERGSIFDVAWDAEGTSNLTDLTGRTTLFDGF